MTLTVREFFEQVPARISPEQARRLDASYRFEIEGAGTWHVEAEGDRVVVAEGDAPADCVVKTDEATFLGIVSGQTSPTTAFLFGKVRVEGDIGLLAKLRDILQ